jgi:hypothetical protein
MAVSAISPISNSIVSIPPLVPLARQITAQDALARVLANSISGPPSSPAALAAASQPAQLLSSLEQALFRNWLDRIDRPDIGALDFTATDAIPGSLGLDTLLRSESLPPVLSDAPTAAQLAITTNLAALFATIQVLGAEADQEPGVGELLDLFA